MAADIELRFNAQVGNTKAVITALEKKVEKLGNKLDAMGRKGRKGAKSLRGGFDSAGKSAARLAVNITGISSGIDIASKALQVFVKEWDAVLERQRKAKQTQITFVQAFDQAILNLSGKDTPKDLQDVIERVQKQTGASQTRIAVALSAGLSSKGPLSLKDLESAIVKTFKLSLNIPELSSPLLTASLTLQKSLDISSKAALGFVLGLNQAVNVVDPALTAQNLVPAIGPIVASGATPRNAGRLLSALTQILGDVTGRKSAQTAIALTRQLEEAFPNLKTFAERLAFVQQNPEAREAFLKGGEFEGRKIKAASFELKSRSAIESLVSGGKVQRFFESADVPGIKDSKSVFDVKTRQLAGAKVRQSSIITKRLESTAEGIRLGDIEGGITAAVRTGLIEGLAAAGAGAFKQSLAGTAFDISDKKPLQAAIDVLAIERANLVGQQTGLTSFLFGGNEGRSEQIKRIGGLIIEFQKLQEQIRGQQPNNRNAPKRVGGFEDPGADALKNIDRKRAERPRAVDSPLQQPGLPANGPAAKPASDETQEKILKCLGGIEEKLDTGNSQRQEQTGVIKSTRTVNRNVHRE